MGKAKTRLLYVAFFTTGALLGGYLFSESQPRSVLALNQCQDCLTLKDIAGLLVSLGVNKVPSLIAGVEFETDKTIVIKSPFRHSIAKGTGLAEEADDYLIIPKKDIRNIGEISKETAPYIIDAYFAARKIIEKTKSTKYRIFTNGPAFQDVSYLHFHLLIVPGGD